VINTTGPRVSSRELAPPLDILEHAALLLRLVRGCSH
jgi:hypothetical protein